MNSISLNSISLEEEKITIRGKTLTIYLPAKLEEVFEGDPFLEVEKFPFWFKIWEASLVLADYLATLSPPKRILELGAGLGVVSLFASLFGHDVLATDNEDLPLQFIEMSALKNNLKLRTKKLDWTNPELSEKFDLIMGSEIIYKRTLFEPLLKLFQSNLNDGGEILLSHSLERKRILVPFLKEAEKFFLIQTSIRRLKSEQEVIEIVLNRLTPKS